MTEEQQEFAPIDWATHDSNYTVSTVDLQATNIYKDGNVSPDDNKTLKAVLRLMGLDIDRPFEVIQLPEGASFRSPITGLLQEGGLIYTGKQRTDEIWKKRGYGITSEYLFGPKSNELIKLLNKD